MRLLLDAQVVLWSLGEPDELQDDARDAIVDWGNWVGVSAATVWEIAIKQRVGTVRARDDLLPALEESGFASLRVSARHAVKAAQPDWDHRDPFDRMLVAQAEDEDPVIVTRDGAITRFAESVLAA